MTQPPVDPSTPETPRGGLGKWLLYGLHWLIIVNFVVEIVYAGAIVFFVLAPEHTSGPLFGAAATLPFELVHKRRLYAHETWMAIGGLAVYLAITEIGPRLRRHRGF